MIATTYKEFLLENELNVGLLNADYNFLKHLISSAKKQRCLKKSDPTSSSDWYKEDKLEYDLRLGDKTGRNAHIIKTNGGSVVNMILLRDDKPYHKDDSNIENSLNPADIIVISHKPFDLKDIELVLTDTIIGNYKNKTYKFTRKLITDSSKSEKPIDIRVTLGWNSQALKFDEKLVKIDLFYVRYEYDLVLTENTKITIEQVEKFPSYIDLISNFPLVNVPNATQRKNGNIMLAIPKDMIIDPDDLYTQYDDKYADWGFGLYATGYVRNVPMYSNGIGMSPPRVSVMSTFDATSIEGWNNAIEMISKKLNKIKKELESRKGVLICTPEDKHKYRGHIAGKKYGI